MSSIARSGPRLPMSLRRSAAKSQDLKQKPFDQQLQQREPELAAVHDDLEHAKDDSTDDEIEYMAPSTYSLGYRFEPELDIDVSALAVPPTFEFVEPEILEILKQAKTFEVPAHPAHLQSAEPMPAMRSSLDLDALSFEFDSSTLIV
eukprot:jgi/Hompol1/4337/HPOL_007056-RA